MKKCKPKKCTECGEVFQPINSLQKVCNYKCAVQRVNRLKERKVASAIDKERKSQRTAHRARKQALKTKSDYMREAQAQVNRYIRLRDAGKPCISCDKPDNGQHQRHASHYRSTAACSILRFNTRNIYASCQQCNTAKSGNLLEYRIRLVKKYGPDLVEWLECQNDTVKYEIDYLIRLKKVFARRCRMLEKRK